MGKVLSELNKQESIEGLTDDLKLVKLWYEIVCRNSSSSNNFYSLVKIKFHKYGTFSYQSYRFYYPSNELIELINYRIN